MQLLRRARLIPVLASLAVIAVFAAVLIIGSQQRLLHRPAMTLNSYDVSSPSLNSVPAPAMVASNAPPPPVELRPGSQAASAADSADVGAIAPVEVSIPRLAYAYALGFRLDGGKIAAAQEAHRALCERMGPARCQLMAMARGGSEDLASQAHLKLRVASAEARRFSDALIKTVAEAGGRAIQTNVTAEDVSKEIVDAEARIRQRELLVARLTEILRSRRGTVGELVEAERSVASAQEEWDQTTAWLKELRGRVAMSDFEISYEAAAREAAPATSGNRLVDAIHDSGAVFLIGIQALLTLAIYLAPWLLLVVPLGFLLWRRARRASGSLGTDLNHDAIAADSP